MQKRWEFCFTRGYTLWTFIVSKVRIKEDFCKFYKSHKSISVKSLYIQKAPDRQMTMSCHFPRPPAWPGTLGPSFYMDSWGGTKRSIKIMSPCRSRPGARHRRIPVYGSSSSSRGDGKCYCLQGHRKFYWHLKMWRGQDGMIEGVCYGHINIGLDRPLPSRPTRLVACSW